MTDDWTYRGEISAPQMQIRQQSITERLLAEKAGLEARLLNINTALEELARNPNFQATLDAVSKVL